MLKLFCCLFCITFYANALTKPDVIFFNWSSVVSGDKKPIVIDKKDLEKFNLKDLELETVLTRNSTNPESYTLLDYLNENPNDYKDINETYNKIMKSILSGQISSIKSGVIFFMITAAEKQIKQIILLSNQQDINDTMLATKNILQFFDEIYSEIDSNIVSSRSNLISVDTVTSNTKYKTCWFIADTQNQIADAIRAGCVPFFVGDIKNVDDYYKGMIFRNKIIVTNFNEINKIIMGSF